MIVKTSHSGSKVIPAAKITCSSKSFGEEKYLKVSFDHLVLVFREEEHSLKEIKAQDVMVGDILVDLNGDLEGRDCLVSEIKTSWESEKEFIALHTYA